MPRLIGVNQMPTRLDGIGQSAQRSEHVLVGREEFIKARDNSERGSRRDGGQPGPIEGVAVRQGNLGQTEFVPKAGGGVQVLLLVVAQDGRDRNRVERVDRLKEVAAYPRGDVEQPYRTARGVSLFDEQAQRLFQQHSSDTNAAPADG